MSDKSIFVPASTFNREELKKANSEILNAVGEILYFAFVDQDDESSGKSEKDQTLGVLWGMSNLAMAVAGMKIVGRNTNGDYVAVFSPSMTIENYSSKNNIK